MYQYHIQRSLIPLPHLISVVEPRMMQRCSAAAMCIPAAAAAGGGTAAVVVAGSVHPSSAEDAAADRRFVWKPMSPAGVEEEDSPQIVVVGRQTADGDAASLAPHKRIAGGVLNTERNIAYNLLVRRRSLQKIYQVQKCSYGIPCHPIVVLLVQFGSPHIGRVL